MAAMRCWQALREAPVPETVEFTVWRVGALDAHGRTVAAPERLVVPTLILAAMSLDQSLVREVLARGADPRATHDGNSASDEATLLRLTPYASEAMARYSVAACSCAKDVVNACVATRTALATARV